MKWKPQDVMALIIVAGCFALIFMGHNGVIHYTLLGVVGVYYGVDLTPFVKLGRRQSPPKDEGKDG